MRLCIADERTARRTICRVGRLARGERVNDAGNTDREQPDRGGGDPLPGRVQRLEESHGFAEHAVEQLDREIRRVNLRLAEAMKRLERLENRLRRIADDQHDGPTDPDA